MVAILQNKGLIYLAACGGTAAYVDKAAVCTLFMNKKLGRIRIITCLSLATDST